MRTFLLTCHRYLGLAVAGFLVLAGLTGSIIGFQHELEIWLNPKLFSIQESGEKVLPVDELVARIEAADHLVQLTYLPLPKEASHAVIAYVEPKQNPASGSAYDIAYDELFVNPVTGEIRGKRLWGECCFESANIIPLIYKLHNRLMLPKPWGGRIMGFVALIWVALIGLGFYLSLPQKTVSKGQRFSVWKHSWQVKRKLPLTPKLMQLHRAAGLWVLPFMLPVALAGMAMNLESELFVPLVKTFSSISDLEPSSPTPVAAWEKPISFGAALAKAQDKAKQSGLKKAASSISYAPDKKLYRIKFGSAQELGFDPAEVFIDAVSGEVLGLLQATDGANGDFLMSIRHSLHTGQILGLPGRLLSVAVGLMTLSLSIVGVALWWRKQTQR